MPPEGFFQNIPFRGHVAHNFLQEKSILTMQSQGVLAHVSSLKEFPRTLLKIQPSLNFLSHKRHSQVGIGEE